MKGICFIRPMFEATVTEKKTQTRRIVTESVNLSVVNGKPTFLSKPRYKVGETIYLKEPYYNFGNGTIWYRFNGDGDDNMSWSNKLFMPAAAARYFIKITDLRAERLQEITNQDCIKEGIFKHISHARVFWKNGLDGLMYEKPRDAYAALINKISGKGTWESNPFVWVYDYKLTEKPKEL